MRMSNWPSAASIVAALCCGWLAPPVNGENLAVNGSFELRVGGEPNSHIDTLTPAREDLLGWQVTGRSIDWIGPTRWKASHGEHCLDIDAPGGIKQTLNTAPGLDYRLQFDLAGNVEIEPTNKVLRVSIDGVDYDFSFDAAGHTRQQLGWVRKEIIFRARSGNTALCFTNAARQPTASGVALDNVVVSEVKPGSNSLAEKSKWIPLAPLVQADRDTQDASWNWDGRTATFGSGKPVARVSIPLAIRGSYELRTRVTIVQAKETTAIHLPVTDGKSAVLHIRGDSGNTASETATIQLEGLNPAPRPKASPSIDVGSEYSLICTVVDSDGEVAIEIRRDDQVLFSWDGLVSQVAEGKAIRPGTVQLQTAYYTSSRFTELRLRMLDGKATPLFPSETGSPSPLVPRDPPEGGYCSCGSHSQFRKPNTQLREVLMCERLESCTTSEGG